MTQNFKVENTRLAKCQADTKQNKKLLEKYYQAKTDFKGKSIIKDKESHCIMMERNNSLGRNNNLEPLCPSNIMSKYIKQNFTY